MSGLQELLHDEGEPIQNSTGLPSDRSRPMVIDENIISLYEGSSKTTDMPGRLPSTNSTLDPIARLPPELATLFIQNALSSQGRLEPSRSSRLIELTTVSEKWQGFLCSTPVFWSELVIDEGEEDFLATLSVFVAFSGKVALKLTFLREPVDWTGLASLLLPVTQRITGLSFEGRHYLISSVIPIIFRRLGHLPQLKEVDFDNMWGGGDLLRAVSLLLPSTVKLRGEFEIKIPEGWHSATPGRFFDIFKYNTFATSGPITPSLQSDTFNVRYSIWPDVIIIRPNGARLALVEILAGRLAERHCFEQAMCSTTHHLQHLSIHSQLSQAQDTIDCLRLLTRLQSLRLYVHIEDSAETLIRLPNDTARHRLRELSVSFWGDDVPGITLSAERTLRNLFSAFEALYPSVGDFEFYGHTWPVSASSYLQSLRALKSLSLELEDSKYDPPAGCINLHYLQHLKIAGPAYLHNLHTPNLLRLELYSPQPEAWPTYLSHPHIHSLNIIGFESTRDFKVLSLNCTDLRHLRVDDIPLRGIWGLLSLSNLVSTTLTAGVSIVNPSSNQLCLALLCYPERLPALQQLHFNHNVDWDILFLMLQRRNLGQIAVKRIDTVTLPFIPFALQQPLSCLLLGEIIELPSLVSLSLEATREVIFDSTVAGCVACMQSMRPGCTAMVSRQIDSEWDIFHADAIYPVEDNAAEIAPAEIRDWLRLRSDLIDIWRASYEEFGHKFARESVCDDFPSSYLP